MMTLGMISRWSEDGFKRVNSFGLKAVEFCYDIGNDPAVLQALVPDIKKWSSQYNVAVRSLGRWGTSKIDEKGAILDEELKNSYLLLDVASELGIPVFNTGCNYVEQLSYLDNCNAAADFFQKLLDYGEKKGVKIATYNCHWNNFVDRPRAWELIHAKLPALGIKFDPSHCINTGSGDYLGETAKWGDRFYHFHVKGTLNVHGEHIDDPPAGLDMVQWRPLLGLLYKKHYNGMLSIEPHSGTWQGDLGEWGVRLTVEYISRLVYPGQF